MTDNTMNNPNATLPTISVDCVIFGYFESELSVLVRREDVPLNGVMTIEWKLPGNHIRRDEDINATAARILKEQTGLEDIYVKQFQVFSDPERLKRRPQDFEWVKPRLEDERVITVGFYSLININSTDNTKLIDVAKWSNANESIELMFDHNEIFTEALKKLRYDLLHEPLIFELLPAKFTLTEMQKVYEVIFNTLYDKRNFRRKINKMPYLIPLDEVQTGVSHKPARFYSFDRDIYEKSRTERFDFRV
jgi:8-oxo-dGTP diphosphatase